MYNDVI